MQRKLVCTSQAVAVPLDFFVAHDSVVHDVDILCEGSFMATTPLSVESLRTVGTAY
jgi:hypothetical protein